MMDLRTSSHLPDQEHSLAALNAFVEFTEVVGTETDVHALARLAIAVLRARFPGSSASYYERDGDCWKVQVWSDDLSNEIVTVLRAGVPSSTPLIADALHERQIVFTNVWDPLEQQIEHTEAYGMAAHIPLIIGGTVKGILGLGIRERSQWNTHDRTLVRAIGRGLTLALERAQHAAELVAKNAELEARTRVLEAFAALTESMGTQSDAHTLVGYAQTIILSLLPDGYSVYYELEDGMWHTAVQTGGRGNLALQTMMEAGLPYASAGTLVTPWITCQPFYQDHYDVHTDRLQGLTEHIKAAAALPVLVHDRPVGVFVVGLFAVRHWRHEDRIALETIVRSLGQALERAQSTAQLVEQSRQMALHNTQIERERVFLAALLKSLTEGIIACDAHGQITLINDAFRSLHGIEAAPLSMEDTAAYYSLFEEDGKTPLPLTAEHIPLLRAWRGEHVQNAQLVIRTKTGNLRHISVNGQPIFAEDGVLLGAVVAMRDDTERKMAEEAVQHSNKELKRSNLELEQFAYMASHDLHAPLRSIMGFVDLLQRKYSDKIDEKGCDYLRQMVDSGQHMRRLLDDLLTFSRVGSEQQILQPIASGGVLDKVVQRLNTEIEATGGQVTHDPLPLVLVDTGQLDSLLQNLVGNALKYHRPGIAPVIHVSAQREGTYWRFSIMDNGIGIAPVYFERVLEIFQRLHTRSQYEGTGVGLAICKKIVERYGGKLWLDSILGQGTTFFFTLPGIES